MTTNSPPSPADPRADVARVIRLDLARQLLQPWLWGFDAAWRAWQSADAPLKADLDAAYEVWRSTQKPGDLPGGVEADTLRVQLLNVAGRGGRAPRDFLAQLLAHADNPESAHSAPKGDPRAAWRDPLMGLTGAPNWRIIAEGWAALTPEFRRLVDLASTADDPTPDSLRAPEGVAWLDRVVQLGQPQGPAQVRALEAFTSLPAGLAGPIASTILDQHLAWKGLGLIPVSGSVQKLDYFAGEEMAKLACLAEPLGVEVARRAYQNDVSYPGGQFHGVTGEELGIQRYDDDEDDDDPQEMSPELAEMWANVLRTAAEEAANDPDEPEPEALPPVDGVEHFDGGFALVELDEAPAGAPALRAGHGALMEVKGLDAPLIVVLEVDLARPEMSFLGLKGTKLVVCDFADPFSGEACFTRVDLEGNVEYVGDDEVSPPEDDYEASEPLVPGRKLYSPFEGCRHAGGLGTDTRVGGLPMWEQEDETPVSPVDGRRMTFVAQFRHPGSGTAYVYLDRVNLIAAVAHQWD